MKHILYSLLTIGSLLVLPSLSVRAAAARHPLTDNPAETERKAAAREKVAAASKAAHLQRSAARFKFNAAATMSRALRIVLGLEDSKTVTSPARLTRRLHLHQQQLKTRARMASRAHHRRCIRQAK